MRIVCFNRLVPYGRKSATGINNMIHFNPGERYLLDDDLFGKFELETQNRSLLHSASLLDPYLPKVFPKSWKGKRVLFYRNHGMGDALIASALPHYFHIVLGAECFALADRFNEFVWRGNPYINSGCSMAWPMHFDSIFRQDAKPFFDYSFFIESISEWDNEQHQENVYDRQFRICGIDPTTVSVKYKRPVMAILDDDKTRRSAWLESLGNQMGRDLSTGYIIYQLRATNLGRTVPLSKTKEILVSLSELDIPLFVTGEDDLTLSDNEFLFDGTHKAINVIGTIKSPRDFAALVQTASLFVGPDSLGTHLCAAFSTPCVGLWGPFSPDSRVKYYPHQVHLHPKELCPHSPCFNYRVELPIDKCPRGEQQRACEVYQGISGAQVLAAAKTLL